MDYKEIVLGLIRQIPLKPKYEAYMFHCPICRRIVRFGYSEHKKSKCDCGQRIDWD